MLLFRMLLLTDSLCVTSSTTALQLFLRLRQLVFSSFVYSRQLAIYTLGVNACLVHKYTQGVTIFRVPYYLHFLRKVDVVILTAMVFSKNYWSAALGGVYTNTFSVRN